MTVAFTKNGWEDYVFWQQNDSAKTDRINDLIKEILRNPFKGIGKPEPLRGNLAGYWSRRISDEHRLVYIIQESKDNQVLTILQARFHYS